LWRHLLYAYLRIVRFHSANLLISNVTRILFRSKEARARYQFSLASRPVNSHTETYQARSRRERSKKLKIARQELEWQQLQERDQHVAQVIVFLTCICLLLRFFQVLSALLGEPSITIHRLSKNPAYLQKLMEIESKTGCPLSVDHPDFPTSMTLFISQPRLHLGLDDHENILIFAVRIELGVHANSGTAYLFYFQDLSRICNLNAK
jgi:hypothetical protein